MFWLSVLLLVFAQAESAPALSVPEKSGVYFRQNNADWINLQPAVVSNSKTKGLELFVYTGGYTNLGLDITCPGARSSTRISVAAPTFYVRGIGSAQDAMLIRLTQKKDRRICKTSFSNVTVDNKGGFRKGDIQKLETAEYPNSLFSVTPGKKLDPGEYLLVFGNSPNGFDFGIDRAK